MIPASFEYFAPHTIEEAFALLATHQDAKVLSGGHSLLPVMKLRLAEPKVLIDIGHLSALKGIREVDGGISLGVLATHYAIETSSLLKNKCALLPQCAAEIGDVQIRNRGTVGGSCVHADPAADYPAAMLALHAVLVAEGRKGRREIAAQDFFVDVMTSAVRSDEILTEIRIPQESLNLKYAYCKVKQSASGFAICGVAVALDVEAKQDCRKISIGITGVGNRAFRALGVESRLTGKTLTSEAIRGGAAHATEGNEAFGDIHASAEYREHLATVYCARAIEAALRA